MLCLSQGIWPLPTQTPHLAPLSAKGGLRGAPRGPQTAGSVAQGFGELAPKIGKLLQTVESFGTGFRVLGFEILGVWHDLMLERL